MINIYVFSIFSFLPLCLCCIAAILAFKSSHKYWSFLMIPVFYLIMFVEDKIQLHFSTSIWILSFLRQYLILFLFVKLGTRLSSCSSLFIATFVYDCYYIYYLFSALFYMQINLQWGIDMPYLNLILCLAYCILLYILFARRFYALHYEDVSISQLLLSLLIFIPLTIFSYYVSDYTNYQNNLIAYACQFFMHLSSTFAIYLLCAHTMALKAQNEKNILSALLQAKQEQYRFSKNNIEIINQKCHDMKHQLLAIQAQTADDSQKQYLQDFMKNIQIYDSIPDTGNESLNIILTEKSLLCQDKNITLSCMIDGQQLSFLSSADLYNIFGNALDNAIESLEKTSDVNKRLITILSSRKKNFVIIQFENYCADTPTFVDDMPVTTKADMTQHGYGMKSIQHTVSSYNGTVSVHLEDHIFILRILFPVAAESDN